MQFTSLPGIDRPMSAQVLGTLTFGDTVDRDAARHMLRVACEAEVNIVDTANGYADGEAERLLGDLHAELNDSMVCTKAGMPHPDAGNNSPLSPQGLRASIEGSLRRLRRESVDLFYLHKPDRQTPIVDTLKVVSELLDQGKIRAWGVSNYSAWQIADLDATADEVGIPRAAVAQQLYNPLARRIEEEYVEFASTRNYHTMAYNMLAGGLLSGKYDFSEGPGTSGRFSSSKVASRYKDRYWNEQLFSGVSALNRLAEEAGLTLVELTLRWVMSQPVTTSVLLGASRAEHLQNNLKALSKGSLPPDLVTACNEATEALRGPMPKYNR
jgi:aryl-alcohol dehydrogenase-like predicted oxidoreductase